jgi:hypothetical protein
MKKRLVVLFATALCLLAAVSARSAWAADPGSRYADAFVLIEQGQAAEEKSDLATAYRSYQSALSALHSIRTDSPDWNSQMVEYRLKDCQSRFDAIKAKLPPPSRSAAECLTHGHAPGSSACRHTRARGHTSCSVTGSSREGCNRRSIGKAQDTD